MWKKKKLMPKRILLNSKVFAHCVDTFDHSNFHYLIYQILLGLIYLMVKYKPLAVLLLFPIK